MKHQCTIFAFLLGLMMAGQSFAQTPPYLSAELPVEERLEDLMGRMSLEEKVGQMCQYLGLEYLRQTEEIRKTQGVDPTSDAYSFYKGVKAADIEALVRQGLIGSFLHVDSYQEANTLQKLAEESPLKIPLLLGIDAIHGHGMYTPGATVFPTPIGLSSSWDTTMVEEVARVTAREMRATGFHWTFSPNVDVSRDPRWGRVGETFGEDAYLVGLMGAAMVRGYQGSDFSGQEEVLACAKHYLGGSQPLRGLNFSPMDISERSLRELWLPPYKAALDEGCYTVMAAHNEVNGVPCHANEYLLNDILRDEWGFKGFVVSDWTDIARLHNLHRVAPTRKEADILAVNNGMDMHMHGPLFFESILEGVRAGRISESTIDKAARSILYAKFQMGLFEHRYVTDEQAAETLLAPAHRELALESARKSMVLLRNEGDLLPLAKDMNRVLVTGPNAHNATILGDWAVPQPEESLITVLEGIQAVVAEQTIVDHHPVADLRNITDEEIEQAVAKAREADVAILVVGENSLRHTWNERTCGENAARATLGLFGRQLELVQRVHATGTPTVVVLVNGRPLALPWCTAHVPAILEAWEPGLLGGQAVAEALFGVYSPSGKLTVSFPNSVGQIPCFYNYKPSSYYRSFADEETKVLYPFGHGLSYTQFEYTDLKVPANVEAGQTVPVSVTLANTGKMAGEEIVILYLNDEYSSVTTPVLEMKAFRRIALKPGESQVVRFELQPEQLMLLDKNLNRVLEPGTFEVKVGGLSGQFEVDPLR
ncbi:glycoside hydrolase family 3 N-terminal domain-containing protein [Phaeodactylibacter xiamenensis]|uniref:glycoside hydrolase family 3 N-terminal domain-containing protein n=1 Tax=Phaeodactylibacter xiamenensis TaxID=1524460 RepID=UPI0024A8F59C|nr:glycoside hydrolase family 3 N-terminal domain-containing protein [Phaeodactylibacter xiamenensis]